MKLSRQLIYQSQRYFAPPKPAAAGKGGPPSTGPAYVAQEIAKTPMQGLIEKGVDFPLGVPAGAHIKQGAHRDHVAPKLTSRIDLYAKKLRDYYLREGLIMESKIFIDYERLRQPEDTMERLYESQLIAGIVEGRDEFADLDLVFPWRTARTIGKAEHS